MGEPIGEEARDLLWSLSADIELVATNLLTIHGEEKTLAWLSREDRAARERGDAVAAAGVTVVRNAVLRICGRLEPGSS